MYLKGKSENSFISHSCFISILQLNSDKVKVERDVDVVGEEDCTNVKMDEVYRPPVLSIKSEYEVSILSNVFVVCVCYSGFVLLDDFTCVRQPFLVHPGELLNYEDVDISKIVCNFLASLSHSQQHW
jgi:hypothetical protein